MEIMKRIAICAALALSACQQPQKTDLMEKCWSEETKSKIASMIRDGVKRKIEGEIENYNAKNKQDKDDESNASLSIKDHIEKNLTVSFDMFHAISFDSSTNHITCGATAKMDFRGKKHLTSERSFQFDLYRGENTASIIEINTLLFSGLVDQAMEYKRSAFDVPVN